MIALADCNNFYASCERVFRPDLYNKPVLVLSNNDGCVIARSNETKALGIKMGVPAFKIKDIINNNNVNVFSSNFTLYGDMSNRVMSIYAGGAMQLKYILLMRLSLICLVLQIWKKKLFQLEIKLKHGQVFPYQLVFQKQKH